MRRVFDGMIRVEGRDEKGVVYWWTRLVGVTYDWMMWVGVEERDKKGFELSRGVAGGCH